MSSLRFTIARPSFLLVARQTANVHWTFVLPRPTELPGHNLGIKHIWRSDPMSSLHFAIARPSFLLVARQTANVRQIQTRFNLERVLKRLTPDQSSINLY